MTTLTRADWEQRAKDLKIEGRAYINGEYTAAVSGDTFECLSPVDGRLLTTVASCDVADAQRAVENARATFNSGVWSRLAPAKRKSAMIRFAALLKANAEELAARLRAGVRRAAEAARPDGRRPCVMPPFSGCPSVSA